MKRLVFAGAALGAAVGLAGEVFNGVVRNRVKGLAVRQGAIALQAEGGAVEFRNLKVD